MTAEFTVLIADAIARDGLAPLRDDSRFRLVERPGLTGADLATAVAESDAVIVRSATRIDAETLASARQLKVVGRAGVGVDTIDVEAATARGIAVLNAPAGNTISAAELSFALLLALVRKVAAADRSMKAGEWSRSRFGGIELHGKTLGLVGAGRVGGEVARRALAFGMQVVAYDPYLSADGARDLGLELAPLETVLGRADVLSLHVPLTDTTAGLLGERELGLHKPSAVLVNAARGGVVNEDALCRCLADGRLAGAALDVFDQEPLPPNHPLRALDNVVLTPHLGASTAEAQRSVAEEIAGAVRAALLEGDFSRAVNAPAVTGEQMRRHRPLLELGERLGRLGSALHDGALTQVGVRYAGPTDDVLRPLTAAALVGVLSRVVGRTGVNFVNALHLAGVRGIQIERVRRDPVGAYAEHLELVLEGDGRRVQVAGAVLGGGHARVVGIDDYHVDVVPRGSLVVLRNRDVPGVIGHVGTVLGGAGVNIAEYHQARLQAGGDALAAISVDGYLAADVVRALAAIPDVYEVRQADLD